VELIPELDTTRLAGTPPLPPERPAGGHVLSRTLKLVFEDEDLAGLDVRARSLSVARMLELTRLAGEMAQLDLRNLDDEQRQKLTTIFEIFAERLVSWNVMDEQPDGSHVPVPATFEGLMSQDFDQIFRVIQAWQTAVAGVAAPLARSSTVGATSAEVSLPMEILSPSQAS
jgi:hypothetical protein